MVRNMRKEFIEMETQARKAEAFVDYEPVSSSNGLFALKCVVSDKKGSRVCRFAADRDITTAQEHAGYMALSAYFGNIVDESLYANDVQMKASTRQNAHVEQSKANQTQPVQTPQNAVNRASQQNVVQARPAQSGQQNVQRPVNTQPRTNTQPAKPGNSPVMPGTYNKANQVQPMQTPQNTVTRAPQQNAAQTRLAQPVQNVQRPVNTESQRPAQNNVQTTEKPEDIQVAVALYSHREKNCISDLLKEEAGRSILRCIYTQDKLTAELMKMKPKVQAYMDYYKIPIADDAFVKTGKN